MFVNGAAVTALRVRIVKQTPPLGDRAVLKRMRLFDSGDEVSCVGIATQPPPTDALLSLYTSCRVIP